MNQSSVDCAAEQACYQIEIKNNTGNNWSLGDQNYRLFFDGDLMTVTSVTSLLPNTIYGAANIDMNIKYSGLGQEAASPLNDIDDNLGFLDFSIIQNNKINPSAAVQLSTTYTAVAEICVDVASSVLTANECLSFYHSRPSTAGGFTSQYTTITENNSPGNTVVTTGVIYEDLTPGDPSQACLMQGCNPGNEWDIQLTKSTVNCAAEQVCYQLEVKNSMGTDWALGDQNYRLFFDGDLMTVVSVTSLLPANIYGAANIDMNEKYSGLGQEANSPLDDIDDNLGFLDFNIIQNNKTNPSAAVQLSMTYTAVAEICVDVDPSVISGDDCLTFYHSRPSTAGTITNQYTTISENDAPSSTTASSGMMYNDLSPMSSVEACIGQDCNIGNEWDIQLTQSSLDCAAEQVCYQLEVKNNMGTDWTLGDQNYRLFFDGDLMTVVSVTSLLPANIYGAANIDMNQKYSGVGQEAASPLNDIDDNLGFLDFNIIQNNKTNPSAAVQLSTTYTAVAEICVDVDTLVINDPTGGTCLSFYHSRAATAGNFTTQYTTITENNAPNSTTTTMGINYNDLTSSTGTDACLGMSCADCPLISANFGNTCDDGNPNTINDIIQTDCSCAGAIQYDCPIISANFGDACDDGNPDTILDEIRPDCSCEGYLTWDCISLKVNFGDACDDGNPNTINDIIQTDCSCAGTPTSCDDLTNPGSIGGSKTICPGENPGLITNVTTPSGGSGQIEYMWVKNTESCNSKYWLMIRGANQAQYAPGILTETTYFRRCARRAGCDEWNFESNCVTIIVDPNCTTTPLPSTNSKVPCDVTYELIGDNLIISGMNLPIASAKLLALNWIPQFECDPWSVKCNPTEIIPKPDKKGEYFLQIKTFEDWSNPGCDILTKIKIE